MLLAVWLEVGRLWGSAFLCLGRPGGCSYSEPTSEPTSHALCPAFPPDPAASFPLLDFCSDNEEEAAPASAKPRRPASGASAAACGAGAADAAGLRACLAVQTKQVAALEGVVAGQAQRISQVRASNLGVAWLDR